MTRRRVVVLAALAPAACHGQFVVTDDGDGGAAACAPLLAPGDPALADGHHNPGADCHACHDGQDPAAPVFSVAGTVYADAAGSAAVAGAAIHLEDADGQLVLLRSADNGNFWSVDPIALPLRTRVSGCPADAPMLGPVATKSCNAASCHGDGFRVHLEVP